MFGVGGEFVEFGSCLSRVWGRVCLEFVEFEVEFVSSFSKNNKNTNIFFSFVLFKKPFLLLHPDHDQSLLRKIRSYWPDIVFLT